ncbi:MAG: AbrB/MazE/SpoVT family DNA-binding domain-containing protein [Halolamina sp.]
MSESGDTIVTDSGSVTVPAAVREALGIQPGDTLRWEVEDGNLRVELVREQPGAFDGFEADELEETNAVEVTENAWNPR